MYDLIITGAGPAGLFTAIQCARGGLRVCILEKMSSPAKKLLISGSGQCNITNAAGISDFERHYGKSGRFVKPSLYNFSNTDMIAFFESRNLRLIEMNEGKIFPETLRANDILDILLGECGSHNVDIKYNEPVQTVSRCDDGFIVTTGKGSYTSKKLMIATGGKSYPSTGSTGDGYSFASSLGHSITETAPCLSSVIVKDYRMQECSGISIRGGVAHLVRNGKKIHEQTGDILFTHKGLSGPAILDMSRYVCQGDCIKVQMSGVRLPEEFEKILMYGAKANGSKSVKNFISECSIPERLVIAILKLASVTVGFPISRLDKKSRRFIAECVTGMPFDVERIGDYNEAMATRGGVAVSEIHAKSMESRLVPGLYFAGEVLDVDGDTGGYNLQFAFSSGKCAADHMTAEESTKSPA